MPFEFDRSQLPLPEPPFQGKIGKTYQDSEAAWPELPAPPEGAPNVVIILLDDVGFGQVSTFGGPVPTPNLDNVITITGSAISWLPHLSMLVEPDTNSVRTSNPLHPRSPRSLKEISAF